MDVIVKRGGERIETRAAQKQGTGLFILRMTPVAGDYSFDVVAKDVAGNTKLEESAVVFSARGDLLAPGPGALLVALAAAAAVALARRGRRDD